MKYWIMIISVFLVSGLAVIPVFGSEHVHTLIPFNIEAGELTEGVALDADGNIFVSLSPLGEIVKVEAGTDSAEPFGAVEGLVEDDIGLLGLAVSESGDVFGAVVSTNAEANGLWRFDGMTGAGEQVAGTEAILLPNAIAFDEAGNVYVTDSVMGAVWRITEDGAVDVWVQDLLLEGNESIGFGIPIGANGIDIHDDTVYVGVLETSSIVTIPIMEDGSAGEATVWAELPEGNHVDGIALDADGNVIVAAPTINAVLLVHADGMVETLATGGEDGLDAPASVVFSVDDDGHQSIYAVNFSVAVAPPGGVGPALLRIDLGESEMS